MTSFMFVLIMYMLYRSYDAIQCIDSEVSSSGALIKNTTCEGALCTNFFIGKNANKTCVTANSFNISTGCAQYDDMDDSIVFCLCDTDFCNNVTVPVEPTVMKPYVCATSRSGPGFSQAPVCSMTIVEQGSKRTIKKAADSDYHNAYLIAPTRTVPLDYFTYHVGIVHTITGVEKNLTRHHYKCYGDKCNVNITESFTTRTDVTCQATGSETCQGEFCVFATNGTVLRYCLSTHKISSNYVYTPGSFVYKSATTYLCKEDNCNSDEESAKASIVRTNRRGGLADDTVPEENYSCYHGVLYISTLVTLIYSSFDSY